MKCYEQEVSKLQMARDNLVMQKEKLMGKQDPISLVALDTITEKLTKVGRTLEEYARLGYIMPSLKE